MNVKISHKFKHFFKFVNFNLAHKCIFLQLELSSGKTRKHKEIESNRRYVMKKMYSALAKMVLKYNPDIKQKFIKFVSDSTVQLPKIMILLGVSIAWVKSFRIISDFRSRCGIVDKPLTL